MTIADQNGGGKGLLSRIPADILIVLALLLTASASFGLGILAGRDMPRTGAEDGLWIEQLPQDLVEKGGGPAAVIEAKPAPKAEPVPEGPKVYVASKNGTKYYLPSCGTASRIKEENKVWFSTKEEAEAAGYGPSSTCKGL